MKIIRDESNRHMMQEQAQIQRKRIKSFSNTDFKLVPLLRKVSCEPDTSNASLKFSPAPDARKFDRKCGREEFAIYDDEEDSISDDEVEDNIVITVGDVLPAKSKKRN